MQIEKWYEESTGGPIYVAYGHVDRRAFRRRLAKLHECGEDATTVGSYQFSYTYLAGMNLCVDRRTTDAQAVTIAAPWRHHNP